MSSVVTHNPLATEFRKKRVAGKPPGTQRLAKQAHFESAQRSIKRSIPGWKHKIAGDTYVATGNICKSALDTFIRHSIELVDAGPASILTPSLAISAVLSTIEDPEIREQMSKHINTALDRFHLEK